MYDEYKGDADIGIEPQTPFETLPSDFFCPHCDTHKDDFVVLPEEIHSPLDKNNLTQLEQAHFPTFEIAGDTLTYFFPEDESEKHYLSYIYQVSLHDEDGELIGTHIFANDTKKGIFDLEYLDIFELRVYSYQYGVFSTGVIANKES